MSLNWSAKPRTVAINCSDWSLFNAGPRLYGKTSYVAQVPWVKAATFKDNVLFGNCDCDEKYHAVLEACALLPDIERLPHADMTVLGERGINLSGD